MSKRVIYYRKGTELRYITISGWQQRILTFLATVFIGWSLFATAMFMLNSNEQFIAYKRDAQIAQYERELQDLRSANALKNTLLSEREAETILLQEKQQVLEDLLNQIQDEHAWATPSVEKSGATILPTFSIEEAEARQSRDQYQQMVDMDVRFQLPPNSIGGIEQDVFFLFDQIDQFITDRTEQAQATLAITNVTKKTLSVPNAMGGPEVYIANLTARDDFTIRALDLQARIAEMHYYEQVIRSLPINKPVAAPHRVSSPFGVRLDPFTHRPALHLGIDIAAKTDSPVVVTAPGLVTFAGKRPGYGLMVEVVHDLGVRTRYAHLASISTRKGEPVSTGHLIGRVGSTGRSTGPHLHYEVWHKGKPQDPKKFLKAGQLARSPLPN